MPGGNSNDLLVPESSRALEGLKQSVIREVGVSQRPETASVAATDSGNYWQLLDRFKYEVADELGLTAEIQRRGWADMPSRELGAIGGRLGGQIGGQMVRKMIALAEQQLAGQNRGNA